MLGTGEVLRACVYSAPDADTQDTKHVTLARDLDEFSLCLVKVVLQACFPMIVVG